MFSVKDVTQIIWGRLQNKIFWRLTLSHLCLVTARELLHWWNGKLNETIFMTRPQIIWVKSMQENLFLASLDPLKWGASSVKDRSKSGDFDGGCPSLNGVQWSSNQVFCNEFDPNNPEAPSKWDIFNVDRFPSLPCYGQGARFTGEISNSKKPRFWPVSKLFGSNSDQNTCFWHHRTL